MQHEAKKPLGEHVKFTKRYYRPYVRAVDLVNSEQFQETVKKALAMKTSDSDGPENKTNQDK